MPDPNLENRIAILEQELKELKQKYSVHQHTLADGTAYLRKNITLDADQTLTVGNTQFLSQTGYSTTDGYNYFGIIPTGADITPGQVFESPNMQVTSTHIPNASAGFFSYLTASRSPLVFPRFGETISVTAAGNTVTINGYDFATNELAGAYINIFNSSSVLVETQTIASNTATVITIAGTWINTTNNATFTIYAPVFLGRTNEIWRRVYVEEGSTTGGIRFGVGATSNTQNGLLYMDATGDIYWRDKAGVSTKLN